MATDTVTLGAALLERDRVLRILREHEAEIRARGVTRLRMFGSMARGEAAPESDVDLIADIDRSARFSLLDLVGLQYLLQDLLGREVDIGTTVERMRPPHAASFRDRRPRGLLMAPPELISRLEDILEAITVIGEYTAGKAFDEYAAGPRPCAPKHRRPRRAAFRR